MKLILFVLLLLCIGLPYTTNGITHTEKEIEYLENKYNTSPVRLVLLNASDTQQQAIDYARSISNDLDFILTIFAESGFRPDAVGDGGQSFGLCQRHRPSGRGRLLDDPRFDDFAFQIDSCWNSYQIWKSRGQIQNRLYGYNVRLRYKHLFVLK